MRNMKAALLMLAVLLTATPARAASDEIWVREDEIEAGMINVLSSCVVFLSNESNDKYITGTLLKTSTTVVLTNYHFLSGKDDEIYASLNTVQNKVEKFRCHFLKGDRNLDLVLLAITTEGKAPQDLISGGFLTPGSSQIVMPYTNKYLSSESFAADSDIKRGYRIAFFGFPLNYGITADEKNNLVKVPVFRSGSIASQVFNGEFLIDAMVSNGNSGSPVFIRSLHKVGGKGVPGYKLIGIMKEYQHDIIKVRLDGRIAEIPHNTGLGIVIPVDTVRAFIEK